MASLALCVSFTLTSGVAVTLPSSPITSHSLSSCHRHSCHLPCNSGSMYFSTTRLLFTIVTVFSMSFLIVYLDSTRTCIHLLRSGAFILHRITSHPLQVSILISFSRHFHQPRQTSMSLLSLVISILATCDSTIDIDFVIVFRFRISCGLVVIVHFVDSIRHSTR